MSQPFLSPYANGVILSIFNQAKEIFGSTKISYFDHPEATYINSTLHPVSLHTIVCAAGFLCEPPQEALPNLADTLMVLHRYGLIGADNETCVRRLMGISPLQRFKKVANEFAKTCGHSVDPYLDTEFAKHLSAVYPDLAQEQIHITERGKSYCSRRQEILVKYHRIPPPRGAA